MSYKGKYQPRNPQKYVGDSTNIIYRSLWERKFMIYCDTNDNVLEYASESMEKFTDTFQIFISKSKNLMELLKNI